MLCRDCRYCKSRMVGLVSSRYWCSLTGPDGKAMGLYPWLAKPHPKCPLNDERVIKRLCKEHENKQKKWRKRNMATQFTTGRIRFSYPNVFTPHAAAAGQEAKYSMCVLIPKTDKATKAKIDEAIREVYEENKSTKFKGLLFEEIQTPLHDGDGRKPKGGAYGEECKGHWVLNASSKNKPGVVGPERGPEGKFLPQTDPTKVWAGEYGRVAINFYAYEVSGNKGVACGLNGVCCFCYGAPIDGRIAAEDAFNDGFEDEMDDEL